MRHQYVYLDPELIQQILAGLDLLRLFNQLVLATGGDVDEAMEWMRYLQQQGHLPEDLDLEAFFATLEDQNLVARDGEGGLQLTTGGERRIRKSAFEEIFTSLDKAGPGYHPVTSAGEGIERLPETRSYKFGDDIHLLDAAKSLQNSMRRNHGEFDLAEEDLEVYETEHLTSCATVVAIDISHSMILYGEDRITPAKTVALALTELITTKYPKDDLEVFETEHNSSCATVVMIDISHSMILYGEDRITPAKKVALALTELILTKYPKDAIDVLLFGDDAREVPISEIPYVQVGPYHTNTKAGLQLAQQILRRRKHNNKQIFMITDGKPSALTENGRLYTNSFGLDMKIVNRTLEEADKCRRIGVPITTFMLATDPMLVNFVEQLSKINRGRAFYSSPDRLGEYILADYIRNRRKFVH